VCEGRLRAWSVLVFLFALLPVAAGADERPQRRSPVPERPAPEKPLEGAAEFSYVATSGNSASQSLGFGGHLTVAPGPWLVRTKLAFLRLASEGELKAKSVNWMLRGSRTFRGRLSGFGQYDYLRNLFAGIEHRHGSEAGMSCRVIRNDRQTLVFDGAFGYAREVRAASADRTSATALAGANYKLKVSPTTDLVNDVRAIQSLAEAPDWRADNELSVATKINSVLSLKVSNIVRYVNDPVPEFERTDTITSVALVAKF
jgi:putative salt-induced outer membrane protein YdiY